MLILMGHKAVGKTTLGQYFADQEGCLFLDSDEVLLKALELGSISQAYQRLGERQFRKEEQEVVIRLLRQKPDVLSLGGGSVMPDIVQQQLRNLDCVQLYLSAHCLYHRWLKLDGFPAFLPKKSNFSSFLSHFEQRMAIYSKLATCVLPVEQLSLEQQYKWCKEYLQKSLLVK